MSIRTVEDIIDDVKYLAGVDTLTNARAIKFINYGLDRYSSIALTSSGRWKFDATTHVDEDDDRTFPIATATLQAGEESIPLETTFLTINQVQILNDGKWQVLSPVDTRDQKYEVLRTTYDASGTPYKYDYDAHSLFIYPSSDTSRTIRVLYSRAVPHVTAIADYLGIIDIHEEYIVDYVCDKVSLRTVDSSKVSFQEKIMKWEGADGVSGGVLRDWFSKRDQDTPKRLKALIPANFMGSSRGKGRRGGRSGFIS